MKRVYIAGPSREWKRVQTLAAKLSQACAVTYEEPWWRDAAAWTGQDATLSIGAQRCIAAAQHTAIRRADLMWVAWPETDGRSALEVEMGIAIALGVPMVVSGRRASECHFTSLATVRESSDDVAIVEIARMIGKD